MEKYLHNCIESLISQTYQNVEIILVNDGSTDNSADICVSYAQSDYRIKVIHQKNGGLSNARNSGTNRASGDYIIYLDADDWIDSDTCFSAIQIITRESADIAFWGHIKEFTNSGSRKIQLFDTDRVFSGESLQWLRRRLIGLIDEELSNPTKTDKYNSAWGKLYRKDLILSNGLTFIDTQIVGSEDVLFNIEAFHIAGKVVYINKLFNHYRQDNPASITKNHSSTLFPRYLNLFNRIKTFIEVNNLNNQYYVALNNRIALSLINTSLSITGKNTPGPIFYKIKSIREIFNNEQYSNALQSFKLGFLPLHWKVYFMISKLHLAFGTFLLTLLMRRFR